MDNRQELHEGGLHREPVLLAGDAAETVAVIDCDLLTGEQRHRVEQWPVLFAQHAEPMLVGDPKLDVWRAGGEVRRRAVAARRDAEVPGFIPDEALVVRSPRWIAGTLAAGVLPRQPDAAGAKATFVAEGACHQQGAFSVDASIADIGVPGSVGLAGGGEVDVAAGVD